jgi:serine/threonine-protein kinase RsbW
MYLLGGACAPTAPIIDSLAGLGHDCSVTTPENSSTRPRSLALRSDLAAIDEVAGLVSAVCHDCALGGQGEHTLNLILEELITNTVRHGRPDPESPIEVRLQREPGGLRITYRDRGTPFDPRHDVPEPDFSQTISRRLPGGLGWPLIFHYCVEVDYQRVDDCNCVDLLVRLEEE